MRPTKSMIAALTALLGLSGCGADSIPFYTAPIVLSCPDYAILEDAATLTAFQDGPGRDITDVTVRAEITQVRMECITDVDSDTNTGHMEIKIIPIIAAEMGAANVAEDATLPYFIAIIGPDKEILYREGLSMDVSFKNNRTRLIALAPSTTVELPITPDIRNRYYQIYTGFELTEQQAAFNRKRIRDRLK